MEGDFSNSDTARHSNPVLQIPAEYDDLYLQHGSYANQRDFSQDINKRMKMPNRLSVDGKNLHDLEVENMRANTTSSHMATSAGMAVPDKITLAGPGQRDILETPYGFIDTVSHENSGHVNITTPPRVLTVEERFPAIQVEPEESTLNGSMNEEMAIKIRAMDKELSPIKKSQHSLMEYQPVNPEVLERRLAQLESMEQQRRNREMLLYPVVVVYISFRFISWLMGR